MSLKTYWWKGPGTLRTDNGDITAGGEVPPGTLPESVEDYCLRRGQLSLVPLVPQSGVAPIVKPVAKRGKRWAYSPAELNGKTLEELNNMIADRAEKNGEKPPAVFETMQEAAAFMMRDV